MTFSAGEEQASLTLREGSFSSRVTESGDLTATVAPASGYDMSGARTPARVISQKGPAVQVSLEQPAYTFGEGDGEVLVGLEARTTPGVPYAPDFTVTIVSKPMEASSPGPNGAPPGDYVPLSNIVEFHSNDFREEDGVLVGHVEVPAITTINSDVAVDDAGLNPWG